MKRNLSAILPALLPKAIEWAAARSAEILRTGRPLEDFELTLAREAEVRQPERIRLLECSSMPQPDDHQLSQAARAIGFLNTDTIGLTLGYGIYVRSGPITQRLLSHEFRHVQQYEVSGSLETFLAEYLHQIVTVGYEHAPLEVDARRYENRSSPTIKRSA